MNKKAAACLALSTGLTLGLWAPLAQARNETVYVALADVLAMPEAQGKLDGSIKFYLSDQAAPPVRQRLRPGLAKRTTSALGKSDEFACKWVALSALIYLQGNARHYGGNAVVDIVSVYQTKETRSDTTIECHVGNVLAAVGLRGSFAQLGD